MRQNHRAGRGQARHGGRRRAGAGVTRRGFLLGAGAAALGAAGLWLRGCVRPDGGGASSGPAAPAAGEWRAAWISYIELQGMDYTSADAFRAGAEAMMDNCAALGLNTVIVQVRPFGDAIYPSALFPWSHICTGTQGVSPGFDPLDLLLTAAHGGGCPSRGGSTPTGCGRRPPRQARCRRTIWPTPTPNGWRRWATGCTSTPPCPRRPPTW